MKQIRSYEELSKLIFAQWKKNLMTNSFLSKESWMKEIEEDRVFYKLGNGFLLLFREREDFYILNYYWNTPLLEEMKQALKVKKPIVVEIVGRDELEKQYQEQLKICEELNFSCILKRERFQKKKIEMMNSENIEKKEAYLIQLANDAAKILNFLKMNFSHYTGCIPTLRQLEEKILEKCILQASKNENIIGVLEYQKNKNGVEIKHLAVAKEYRGKRIASQLLNCYEKMINSNQEFVWTGKENKEAQELYKKFGYQKDGFVSSVYQRKNGHNVDKK